MDITPDLAVLLKAEKCEDQCDPYVEELLKVGINADVVPVMSFKFLNGDILQEAMQAPDDYAGIIFTSSRAVKAVEKAVHNLPLSPDSYLVQWNNKPNYAVGVATSNSAKLLLNLDTEGKDAGNSANLCDIIVQTSLSSSMPFIFPCSVRRKQTISSVLQNEGIGIKEIVCYEPVENSSLEVEFKNSIIDARGIPEYVVFFSPSGVKFALEVLRNMYPCLSGFKFAAIGTSTRDALQEAGLNPVIVAKNPTPVSLAEAFKMYSQQKPEVSSVGPFE